MKKNQDIALKSRDTAMAFTFLALLLYLFIGETFFLTCALIILFIAMIFPKVFAPLSRLWFGLGELLGEMMSRLILLLTYIFFIFPVALLKKNSWDKKFYQYKNKENPLHHEENPKIFLKEDLENPY